MTKPAELARDLSALLLQLEVRGLYAQLKVFLADKGVRHQTGWDGIERAIDDQLSEAGAQTFVDALERFVGDAVLVSHKRVFVIDRATVTPNSLATPLPSTEPRSYLSPTPPKRTAGDFTFYLGQQKRGTSTIHTFVTSRPARRSDDLDASKLTREARKRYKGARITAKFDIDLKCYDQIIISKQKPLLLLDAPDGVDAGVLSNDGEVYARLIAAQQPSAVPNAPLFVDLFPAVGKIWIDKSEGVVNHLQFVSNKAAQIGGKFSPTSDDCYRSHPFQVAGGKVADVHPYRIAVKWPNRQYKPVVLLPGKPIMVSSGVAGTAGATGVPLNYMSVPVYTNWDDFAFAVDRVQSHI